MPKAEAKGKLGTDKDSTSDENLKFGGPSARTRTFSIIFMEMGNLFSSDTRAKGKTTHTTQDELFSKRANSVQNVATKDNGRSKKQSKTKTPHADRHQKELSKDQSGKTTQTDMCSYESTKGKGRSNKHNKAVNLVPDVKDNGKGQSNKRSETATDQPAGWRQDKPAESTTKINSNHDSVQNAAAKDNGQSEKQSKTKTPPADQLKKELSKDESGKPTQIDMCSHESTKGKGRSNKNNEAMNVVPGLNQYVKYNGKGQSNKCSKTVTAQSAGRCQDKATEGKRLTEPTTKINSNHDTGPTTTVQNDNEQNKSKIKEKHKTGNTENEYILLTQKLSTLHDSQFFTARHVLYNVDEMLKKLDQPWPVDDLYARLTKEQEEKSRLLTKLSELAGDRLKNDNPAITDLSDLNRPAKLAERFSEIYDYEWTDVMEFLLEKMDEDCEIEMIKFLLSTIVKCYEVCVDMSTKQIQDISKLFCVSPNQSIEAKDIPKSCKDYQKTMFESSMEYIMTQYRDELLNGNSELFGKQKQLYEAVKYISCYKTYVTKCFKICWHMRIQDPPIFMKSEGGDDPKKVFRAYTQSGPYVDFVVWPALMLYEGGTILYRGVAQYTKAGP